MDVIPTSPHRPFGHQARIYLLLLGVLLALFLTGRVLLVQNITFMVDGEKIIVESFGGTVAEALEKGQIKVAKEDLVKPTISAQVEDGMTVVITRAVPLTIQADGHELAIKSPYPTVEQVLGEAGVKLGSQDKVSPSLKEPVVPDQKIRVIRVTEKEEQVEEAVAFETVRRKDRSMPLGEDKVIQEGQKGLTKLHYRIVMEDGKPVKKELVSKTVLKPALSRIIAIGTMQTVSRGGAEFSYSKALSMKTSAYTHTGNRTASGVYPTRGVVAVDPSVIPFGTKLYIEGYGYATALDKGSAIKGNRLDLFFETRREAINWGLRTKKAYILD